MVSLKYFGKQPITTRPLQNALDLIFLSREGISKKALLILAYNLSFSQKEIADIVHLSERTLQRYPDEKRLNKEATATALQLAALYQQGEEIFGELDHFKGWMDYPNPVLGGKKPVELLDTPFGFQWINDELIRIAHGVLA
jgi:putative toxin-antitoxin system antitoxin component (TIGR02293 family)